MPLTKDTMTLADVPEHATPGEFLDDAGLADLYERELAALDADDPARQEAKAQAGTARIAAITTSAVQARALIAAQAAIVERAAQAADEVDIVGRLLAGEKITDEERARVLLYRDARSHP
jgi:adenosylcobinamide amidohydrolase